MEPNPLPDFCEREDLPPLFAAEDPLFEFFAAPPFELFERLAFPPVLAVFLDEPPLPEEAVFRPPLEPAEDLAALLPPEAFPDLLDEDAFPEVPDPEDALADLPDPDEAFVDLAAPFDLPDELWPLPADFGEAELLAPELFLPSA